MQPAIRGLHHVTATVNDAQADVDFYTGVLGLRLVKKTVNFDNHHVYHFYYGNRTGVPGTLFTTFPYKGKGVPTGSKGAGQITATAFSVPAGALPGWRARLAERGVTISRSGDSRFGDEVLGFEDPSGLVIELIATPSDSREPWIGENIDPAIAIRGLHSVTLTVRDAARSSAFLTSVLGYSIVAEEARRTRLAAGSGGPGRLVDLLEIPDAPAAINGLGTVHHVAMGVETLEEQLSYRARIHEMGVRVTEVLDRQYFRSIYFREPGGVLYEIATIPPGFLVDEPVSELGTSLRLPPWEEPNRAVIEQGLPPLRRSGEATPRGAA